MQSKKRAAPSPSPSPSASASEPSAAAAGGAAADRLDCAGVKRLKTFESVDFCAILQRSHSLDEGQIERMAPNTNKTPKFKIINDSIHGHITLHPSAVAIIDTPQFQRLRFLKQVGTCHFVFPTATHTRFQHSLGVAHLAQKFAELLRKDNPDLVDEKDVICVMLAGLCHDLGHGPFSHLWEFFVREAGQEWHHESSSVQMLDHLIEDNCLMPILNRSAGLDDKDILFIKELIAGPIDPTTGAPSKHACALSDEVWPYQGRPESKSFLYDIVANKNSGIDVDKWDYTIRDDYYMKIGRVFEYERFMSFSKVMKVGESGRRKICLRDKEAELVLEMYQDRARLHRHGYQHRVSKIIDRMMVDAFLIADRHIRVCDKKRNSYSLSEACQEITALSKLSDEQVFFKILESEDYQVMEAKDILSRILKRDFYVSVAEINVRKDEWLRTSSIKYLEEEIRQCIQSLPVDERGMEEIESTLLPEELIVLRRVVNMGMADKNPMNTLTFYTKDNSIREIGVEGVANMSEESFASVTLWVCCKRSEARPVRETLQAVKKWTSDRNISDISFGWEGDANGFHS